MQLDPTDILGLEDMAAERQEQDKLAARQVADDHLWLMSSPRGRRLVAKWLDDWGVNDNPFTSDPAATGYRCGLMKAGQELRDALMHLAPDGYLLMIKETTNAR